MSRLKIAPNLELPLEAVTQTFAILAKRGSGKTYTASVMVEEMLKANLHVVVIDPIGVWFGLRSSSDGKHAGLPIVIAGGEHADVPIELTSGEILAEMIVEQRMSMVIDLSLFRKGEQHRFMIDFAETLYRKNRQAVHLVLDEADEWAPQRTLGDEARMLGAIEDLVRRGRARGIGVTMITQRPAVLNKNVLTQIEVLVALRLTSPQDRAAIAEWVKYHADNTEAQQMLESLGSLPIGTAWFWSPGWLNLFKKVAVRKRETLDSSSTPKAGEQVIAPQKFADVDLEKIKAQLSATIEKVESDDPKALRHRIAELEKQAANQKPQVEIREVVPPALIKKVVDLTKQIEQLTSAIDHEMVGVPSIVKIHDNNPSPGYYKRTFYENERQVREGKPAPVQIGTDAGTISDHAKAVTVSSPKNKSNIIGGALRMLQVLASRYPMAFTKPQLAILANMSPKSGTYGTYLSLLKSQGLIEVGADVSITDEGLAYIGTEKPQPQTQEEILDMWRNNLTGGARRMFDVLIEVYPSQIDKAELGMQTEMSHNSGTFGTYLSMLKRNGLVEVTGTYVKANPNLFAINTAITI